MKSRAGKLLPPIASFVIIAAVLWRKLAEVDPTGVGDSFAAIQGSALVLAGLFTAGALTLRHREVSRLLPFFARGPPATP